MKTSLKVLFLAIAVMASATFGGVPTSPEPMSGKTVLQFWADNGIKIGWNLGNTLDAHKDGVGTEGDWDWSGGPPKVTQALFNGVKQSGFDIVRIPVTWTGHISSSPDYTVSQARLQRVVEIIDYAKNAGIKAMIINIHHDGLYMDKDGGTTLGFLNFPKAENDANEKTKIQNELVKVWTQIANYFKNYGDYLIFETMNEVHNGNWGNGSGSAYEKQQDLLFDWNQAALDAIRATGGNNATRFVAVPGLGSTEPETVINAHNRGKLLPSDGTNGTGKLIVSVHYYYPWQYTVADVNGADYTTEWKQSERGRPASDMGSLKSTFINNGIAVYAGEWGAPNGKRASSSAEIKATHREYIKTVATKAVENGVVPIFWDDNGNFKLLNRSNGQAESSNAFYAEVLSDIMSAVKNAPTSSSSNGNSSSSSSSVVTSSSSSNPVSSSSSSDDATPIISHSPLTTSHPQAYYSLKGDPLGNTKPTKAGIYIFKQGSSIQKIAVR
jgi:endoglucanase